MWWLAEILIESIGLQPSDIYSPRIKRHLQTLSDRAWQSLLQFLGIARSTAHRQGQEAVIVRLTAAATSLLNSTEGACAQDLSLQEFRDELVLLRYTVPWQHPADKRAAPPSV